MLNDFWFKKNVLLYCQSRSIVHWSWNDWLAWAEVLSINLSDNTFFEWIDQVIWWADLKFSIFLYFCANLLTKLKYCQLIFKCLISLKYCQTNKWLALSIVLSADLPNKDMIADKYLIDDKYFICDIFFIGDILYWRSRSIERLELLLFILLQLMLYNNDDLHEANLFDLFSFWWLPLRFLTIFFSVFSMVGFLMFLYVFIQKQKNRLQKNYRNL